ncbi:mitochondrial import inner membrane translocase subunit Tim22 isoform X1 [Nerophis ophidion]|uniref:mitochondrial import inner membrane translocase subunit Tim22 isoform X1 n=1 Tax=Nerophis ophidion TaxID=159077 RepID=UPI002ADF8599|nr:mitochondrial import inner membrane translocase subunit Tim22 isoform X1 [Nerophis ophidion]
MAASASSAEAALAGSKSSISAGQSVGNTPIQYSMILDHLIGDKRTVKDMNPGIMGGLPVPFKSEEQKRIERAMESCAFKSILACVGGFVLGGAFGVFTAGIDTNVGFDPKDPARTPTAREVLRDMGQRGMSYAKNFAIVGAMFSCTECIIESFKTWDKHATLLTATAVCMIASGTNKICFISSAESKPRKSDCTEESLTGRMQCTVAV